MAPNYKTARSILDLIEVLAKAEAYLDMQG